jgi:hypothetical protein
MLIEKETKLGVVYRRRLRVRPMAGYSVSLGVSSKNREAMPPERAGTPSRFLAQARYRTQPQYY